MATGENEFWVTEAMIRRVIREELANHFVAAQPSKLAYTVEEAAAATGYSPSLIRGQIRNNYLTVVYAAGKTPVIQADELKRWVESLPEDPRGRRMG